MGPSEGERAFGNILVTDGNAALIQLANLGPDHFDGMPVAISLAYKQLIVRRLFDVLTHGSFGKRALVTYFVSKKPLRIRLIRHSAYRRSRDCLLRNPAIDLCVLDSPTV